MIFVKFKNFPLVNLDRVFQIRSGEFSNEFTISFFDGASKDSGNVQWRFKYIEDGKEILKKLFESMKNSEEELVELSLDKESN